MKKEKRISILVMVLGLCVILSGCVSPKKILEESKKRRVDKMVNWSFQENAGSDDYSVFFGFVDEDGDAMAIDVEAEIRIENELGEKVYFGKRTVTERDFENYTSKISGENYLAEIRIPKSEIKSGKSANGKIYIKIFKDNELLFDEVNCDAFYCLPLLDCEIQCEGLPKEIVINDYYAGESVYIIEKVEFEKDNLGEIFCVSGVKKSSNNSEFNLGDKIEYKVYDSEGYIVENGMIMLDKMEVGDKFRTEKEYLYDLEPGEKYTLVFE